MDRLLEFRLSSFFRNKKGAEKYLSPWWFAILFIVAGGIVYMVALFYGKPYDIREVEANLLAEKIADCVVEQNYLKTEILNDPEFKTKFLEYCDLNFNAEDSYGWSNDQYYAEFGISDFSTKKDFEGFPFYAGNPNLKDYCGQQDKNFPFCVEKSFYVLDKTNKQYIVKIISIVRKTEKNAKQ